MQEYCPVSYATLLFVKKMHTSLPACRKYTSNSTFVFKGEPNFIPANDEALANMFLTFVLFDVQWEAINFNRPRFHIIEISYTIYAA